jgi:hypothetical protein
MFVWKDESREGACIYDMMKMMMSMMMMMMMDADALNEKNFFKTDADTTQDKQASNASDLSPRKILRENRSAHMIDVSHEQCDMDEKSVSSVEVFDGLDQFRFCNSFESKQGLSPW